MNEWTRQWFAAAQANRGGVIRRSRKDIDKYSSLPAVVNEARNRGWHVIETGNQVVLLCHEGELLLHC
jgi:hypothetical protein